MSSMQEWTFDMSSATAAYSQEVWLLLMPIAIWMPLLYFRVTELLGS